MLPSCTIACSWIAYIDIRTQSLNPYKNIYWYLFRVLKKITKKNFHHGALTVTIFMIVIFASTKLLKLKRVAKFFQVLINVHPCHSQLQTIDLCHVAAILSQEIKKALYLRSQPPSYCQANCAKTKLFKSPGIKWPLCDKGLQQMVSMPKKQCGIAPLIFLL